MKKIGIISLAAAVALTGSMTVLPTSPAYGQSGSRMCGWTANTPSGVLGLLYEARDNDASYGKQCDEAISKMWDSIQKNPQLKALSWTKRRKETCESVGGAFMSANSPQDMCDMMEAKVGYKVTKNKASNSTTYEKQ